MKSRSTWAILLAGGVGRRMGLNKPKQLITIGGFPLIVWSFHALDEACHLDGMVVVSAAEHLAEVKTLLSERARKAAHLVFVPGGATRQDSVRAGLAALKDECEDVLVHDGARPFIGAEVLERLMVAREEAEAVIPGVAEKNTLKRVDKKDFVQMTLNRNQVYEVQTPQLFSKALLVAAHDQAQANGFVGTDDASLVEELGEKVKVVTGDEFNLKVTTKRDIFLMKCLIASAKSSPGSGPPQPEEPSS